MRGIGMGKKRCGEDGREVSDDATEAFIYAKRIHGAATFKNSN